MISKTSANGFEIFVSWVFCSVLDDENADTIRHECSRDASGHLESSSRKASTSLRERGRERGVDLEQVRPVQRRIARL